jgi:hypothetical protein
MKCMICGSVISQPSKIGMVFCFIDGITDVLRRKFGREASDLKMSVINGIKNQVRVRGTKCQICRSCIFDMMVTFSSDNIRRAVVKMRNLYFSISPSRSSSTIIPALPRPH